MTGRPRARGIRVVARRTVEAVAGIDVPAVAGDTPGSRALLADAALAVVFGVVLVVDVSGSPVLHGPAWGAYAMSVAMAMPLAVRRRYPAAGFVVNTAALAVQATFFVVNGLYPYTNLIGIYSVGAHATPRRARAGLLVGLVGVAVYFTAADAAFAVLPLLIGVIWTLAWATGFSTARRLRERDVAHAAAVDSAASGERLRIAREVHDVIGHTVNVMVVQAGAGRRIIDRDPERAKRAMASIEQTGRAALDELDRVLGMLRDDSPPARTPQPGLAALAALPARFAAAGLTVDVTVEGEPPATLPRSLEVSVYRIVTEALTNTLKHAHARHATVAVHHHADRLELEVVDDGTAGDDHGGRRGRGLTGIAERVMVFGGDLQHGPRPEGGFGLRAALPVTPP